MTPTRQDLKDAGCWFAGNAAGGSAMTDFKREASWRQHRWAVNVMSVSSFGSHLGRRVDPDVAPDQVANGTKLLEPDANAGSNFLTPAIFGVAQARLHSDRKEKHETHDATRLFRDLLSSMPMAFNLFGEASLPESGRSRNNLAEAFGVGSAEPPSSRTRAQQRAVPSPAGFTRSGHQRHIGPEGRGSGSRGAETPQEPVVDIAGI